MKYLVFRSADLTEAKSVWGQYRQHMQSIAAKLPAHAKTFASQDWYYDPNDHRCPHDSWLIELIVHDSQGHNSAGTAGEININVHLLGAYHDHILTLTYHNVRSYRLLRAPLQLRAPMLHEKCCHGDWLVDEFDVTSDGYLTHEIEWSGAGTWYIEAQDISFADSPNH